MSDAEFVDKIITEEVDAAKLADLLRQRIARTDESDESDHFSEVRRVKSSNPHASHGKTLNIEY